MQTLFPQLDKLVKIEPCDIVLIAGYEPAVESAVTGLVMTADDVEWYRFTDKKFVSPKPSVKVFDWNSTTLKGVTPQKEAIIVMDGIQDKPERFNWNPMLDWINEFAKEHHNSWVFVATDEEGTRLDPASFLSESFLKEIRKHATYEIVFAQRHFSEVQCVIRRPSDPDYKEKVVCLGSPIDIADGAVKRVSASFKQEQEELG